MISNDALRGPRPRLDDLPIMEDVAVDARWSEFMSDLAAQIGAYHALILIDQVGGMRRHVPHPMPDDWFVIGLIGREAAETVSFFFSRRNKAGSGDIGQMITFPTADYELRASRLDPIIQAVRAKTLSYNEAAYMTGYSVRQLCHIANATERGTSAAAYLRKEPQADPRQSTIFDIIEEAA